MDEKDGKEAAPSLLKEMEATAARMRKLIAAMPPHDLLGYIYAQGMIKAIADQNDTRKRNDADDANDLINENQFLLEYVHAVLASDEPPPEVVFNEAQCAQLFALGRKLQEQAMFFAMLTSSDTKDGVFGPDTANIEFRAKTSWVILRGSRYQVLEGEFYHYVLTPHDDVLKEVYGVSAADIANGFQAMANATRSGHADAMTMMMAHFEAAHTFAAQQDKPLDEAMKAWIPANAEGTDAARRAMDDMFRGGIANVSRHTNLPAALLADLAYRRGEEKEFFAPGDFSGTPYRTLPARKKPLIQLGSDYYAVDPCFTRDAGYRALLYNLLQRKPDYKKTFEERQKTMSESAFADILAAQLPGAKVFQEVYYKDPASRQWSENDTLILIDDVLFLVEAKAGAAATIASPALDFGRHAQSVQDLVLKAYKQCERFFNYLSSADEVPLFYLVDGKYEECGRIRRSDYRVMMPIGLTIESFSPFSAYCKELPQVKPLLGKHAFVSLSIDDLFVLERLLPTPGEFAHYMEVRQAIAGMRRAHLFDEFDHLGAYLMKNRVELEIADQMKDGATNLLIWDRMSDVVDKAFTGEDWENRPFPTQTFPKEVLKLLGALNAIRAPKWLAAESHIRDFAEDGRVNLGNFLRNLRQTLNQHPTRYFVLSGDGNPLFVWLQKHEESIDWRKVNDKASAAALAVGASYVTGVLADVGADGTYYSAQYFAVHVPTEQTGENTHIFEDAGRMAQPARALNLRQPKQATAPVTGKKPGRNEPCPCSSGLKFKKCHGK